MSDHPTHVYHGTSEKAACTVLKQGRLRPRGERASNWGVASRNDCIYLTTGYAPYFAAASVNENERWAIIEVELGKLRERSLLPDEDFIEQATRTRNKTASNLVRRTKQIRENLLEFQENWSLSLNKIGNVAYQGTIRLSSITKIVLFDPKSNPHIAITAMDPTITILNWMFCGEKYCALTRWFMDQPVTADEIWMKPVICTDDLKQNKRVEKELAQRNAWLENRSGLETIYTRKP
jgi:hypothetical protein